MLVITAYALWVPHAMHALMGDHPGGKRTRPDVHAMTSLFWEPRCGCVQRATVIPDSIVPAFRRTNLDALDPTLNVILFCRHLPRSAQIKSDCSTTNDEFPSKRAGSVWCL